MKPLVMAAILVLATTDSLAQQLPLDVAVGDQPFSRFGQVMSLAGDVDADGITDVIVGAPKADLDGDRRGQAFVLSGVDLSVLHRFDGTADLHELGTAVDGAGDVDGDGYDDLIVGEPWPYSDSVVTGPAHAYVFSGFDGHVIHVLAGTVLGDEFGHAVAGLGDVDGDGLDDVAVGAPDLIGPGGLDGRVAVFSGLDGTLLFDVPLPATNLAFGASLDTAPDRSGDGVPELLVGAPRWVGPNAFSVGAVFAVSGADGTTLTVYPGGPYGQFDPSDMGRTAGSLGDVDGDGVADVWAGATDLLRVWSGVDGSVIRDHVCLTSAWDRPHAASLGDVDADGRDDYLLADPEALGTEQYSGHARVISGADGVLLMLQRGTEHYGKLGSSALALGDSDGDGRPEFALGRPHHASVDPGEVLVFEYRPMLRLLAVVDDDPIDTGFGSDVRAAGDVDADGTVDVIVGETWDDTIAGDAGRVRVFSGRDGTLLHDVFGDAILDHLGWSVDGVGDLDGDGHADFASGLPFRKAPLAGAVRVWSGRTGVVLHDLEGLSVVDRFGLSLAGLGDLDGDGVSDLAIGAPFDDTGFPEGGRVLVVSGAEGSTVFEVIADAQNLALGHSLAGGGDVDGDGVPDLLVGVPNQLVGGIVPGTVRVVSGATGTTLHQLAGELQGSQFGVSPTSLAIVGDLDGDGFDDVLVGSPTQGSGSHPKGKVAAFSGLTGAPLWSVDAGLNGHTAGASVARYVDVDGDGRDDVLVGVPGAYLDDAHEGEVRLLSGADGGFLFGWPSQVGDARVGTSVDTMGDLDFDGLPEVLMAGDEYNAGFGRFTVWLGGDASSPWQDQGHALPGTQGAPALVPAGMLAGGTPVSLSLSSAAPGAAAGLLVGFTAVSAPFKGGVLVPTPDLVLTGLTTDGVGAIELVTTWPVGLPPGFATWHQLWIADGAAPKGASASNAVRGVTP